MNEELVAQVRSALSPEENEQMSNLDIWRFVVARKKNTSKAVTMIRNYLEWLDKVLPGSDTLTPRNILELYATDPNEEVYEKYFPHSNLGHSLTACPIYWEKTGICSVNFQAVNKILSVEDLVIRHVRQQELVFQRRCARASQFFEEDVTKQVIVFDLKNLSYSLDTNALSAFRQTLAIDEAYYPERLAHFVMINAPWFFTAIWSLFRSFIDPVTAEKFVIVGSDYLPTLRRYIDDSQIPEELGGSRADFAWTFPGNLADPDELLAAACSREVNAKAVTVPAVSSSGATTPVSSEQDAGDATLMSE